MITYKIRDKEKNKYRDDMIADWEWYIYSVYRDWYWLQCLTTTDQSRYTIEREISDDVLDNLFMHLYCQIEEFEKWKIIDIIKKHLNQKTS